MTPAEGWHKNLWNVPYFLYRHVKNKIKSLNNKRHHKLKVKTNYMRENTSTTHNEALITI